MKIMLTRMGYWCFVVALAALVSRSASSAESQDQAKILGCRIPNFVLPDGSGREVALSDFNDARTLVVVFLGTQCPIGNAYVPVLNDLQNRYGKQGVQVLAINSNLSDNAESVAKHVKEFEVDFPVLVDDRQVVADMFAARRTPEAFVLDRRRVIQYRGRIDDRFGYTYKRAKARRNDVEEAVKELLAGKDISIAETKLAGCVITREDRLKGKGKITFAKHVAHILQKNCAECHHPGTAAPFSLLTYEDARNWSGMIRETVVERRMPPWSADPRYGHWENDRRMSSEEIDTLVAWIDGGMRMGDRRDLPKPVKYADGWRIGKPDMVLKMPREYTVQARGTVEYQYFVTPTNFDEDVWVQASEARPGNWAAVHHIIVFVREKGSKQKQGLPSVGGYAPGEDPLILPKGVGFRIPAGADLVWQVHYTPTGKVETDRSEFGLYLCPQPPPRERLGGAAINTSFRIPAGAENHRVVARKKIRRDIELIELMPHMHLRGRNFKYTAHYPDGRSEILLSVPNYDFNWQHRYRPSKPLLLPKGTIIQCEAYFDNSPHNPANPDSTKEVRWGDQSWEEMMIGFYASVEVRSSTTNADLWSAANTGDVNTIHDRLKAGADINSRSPQGQTTALFIAALYGRTKVVKVLLDHEADVTIPSEDGATPLLVAAYFGRRDIVTMLLDSGANVNARKGDGTTPLDTVHAEWSLAVEASYKFFERILKLDLDVKSLKSARPKIAALLRKRGGKRSSDLAE